MKNRTWITVVLSLVLALMLPLTSLAAMEISVGIMPGDMIMSQLPEEVRPAITDLFNALTINSLMGEKSSMFSLKLNGQSALDLAFRAEGDDIYLQTEVLGDKALYFNKNDLVDLLVNVMKQEDPNADEAALRDTVDQMFAVFGTSMSAYSNMDLNALTEPVDFAFDKDAILAQFGQMYGDDPGMVAYMTAVLDKIEVAEGEFTSDKRDAANVCMTMTMTSEDFMLILDSKAMQATIAQIAAQNNVTEEQAKDEIKKEFEKMDMNLLAHVYLNKVASEFIGMDMNMEIKEDKNDPSADTIAMVMDLNRLTTDVATYTFTMTASEDGKPEFGAEIKAVDNLNNVMDVDGSVYEIGDDGTTIEDTMLIKGNFATLNDILHGWLSMVTGGTEVSFVIGSQPIVNGVSLTMELYTRENAVAPLEPAASAGSMFAIKYVITENVSEEPFAAINSATPDTSVQLLKMSEAELNQFMNGLQANAINLVAKVISLLPESLQQLVFGLIQ